MDINLICNKYASLFPPPQKKDTGSNTASLTNDAGETGYPYI